MAGKWKKWSRDGESSGDSSYARQPAEDIEVTPQHTDSMDVDPFETNKRAGGTVAPTSTFGGSSSTGESNTERAAIGASLRLVGDLSGQDDLVIHGRVDGKVNLPDNTVVVGKSGKLKANVSAKRISVEGEVEGDLTASEQIVVRRSGNVQGNLHAPSVSLEDGCKFNGAVNMQAKTGSDAETAMGSARTGTFSAVAGLSSTAGSHKSG
jgi:cytoskeletal protein CcmA (bactofilin family)